MPGPVLDTNAPYDSLGKVTSLTRTILADYIAGLQPDVSGVVNSSGLAVTWVSGSKFTYLFNGVSLTIGGTPYPVVAVNSPTSLTLGTDAGSQAGVAYSGSLPTGDFFADSQAYVLPTINLAWRKLQRKLADKGHPRLEKVVDLPSLPIVTNLDPASQQWMDWTNFFDGTNLLNPDTTVGLPLLPADFISPLRLWERPSTGDTTNFNRFRPMHPASDSLVSRTKGSWNRYWDWLDDKVFLPGCIIPTDVRARYAAFKEDIIPVEEGFDFTPVPIMRAGDALAYYAAAEFVEPRGGTLAQSFSAQGDEKVDQITNSSTKLQARASYSRRPWGNRGRRRMRY